MPSKTYLMLRRREAPSRSTQSGHAARPDRSGAAGCGAGFRLSGLLGAGLRLRLGGRFLRRLAVLRFCGDAGIAEETRDPVARQGADAEPMLDAVFLQGHALGMAAVEHRVVGAELFDEAAVARAARVGDN